MECIQGVVKIRSITYLNDTLVTGDDKSIIRIGTLSIQAHKEFNLYI